MFTPMLGNPAALITRSSAIGVSWPVSQRKVWPLRLQWSATCHSTSTHGLNTGSSGSSGRKPKWRCTAGIPAVLAKSDALYRAITRASRVFGGTRPTVRSTGGGEVRAQLKALAVLRLPSPTVPGAIYLPFGRNVQDVTPEDVRLWLSRWDRGLKTKANYHGLLFGVFAWAVEEHALITVNPCV